MLFLKMFTAIPEISTANQYAVGRVYMHGFVTVVNTSCLGAKDYTAKQKGCFNPCRSNYPSCSFTKQCAHKH